MTVVQANYPVGMDTSATGYPIPKISIDGQSVVNGTQVKMTQYSTTGIAETINADGSTNINQLGRNYQEVVLFNSQAILDTVLHTGTVMNTNTIAGQNSILINNTLDQPVTLSIFIKNQLGQSFNIISGLSIPAGGQSIQTDANAPVLKCPIYQMYATAQCAIAPTVGGVSVTVGGVQA